MINIFAKTVNGEKAKRPWKYASVCKKLIWYPGWQSNLHGVPNKMIVGINIPRDALAGVDL